MTRAEGAKIGYDWLRIDPAAARAAEYADIVRECREIQARCAETGQKTIGFVVDFNIPERT